MTEKETVSQSSVDEAIRNDHTAREGTSLSVTSAEETTPYTAFSLAYRWYLTILLGYLCLASSLTANIYFPLITLLTKQYHASPQAINLTITIYLVIQGISPSIFSPLSDTLGRRPVYLLSFSLYAAASVGLAFSGDSYAALLVLRALQSAGGSATLSLAYSVVSGYAVHAERGKFLAPMVTATNIGPSIGPPIGGGAILATGDPRWAFWTLVIFGGSALTLVAISMRETNRRIVGNGSVPAKGIWRAWWDTIFSPSSTPTLLSKPTSTSEPTNPHPPTDSFTILYLAASPYGAWYTITASIPLIYGLEYRFNDLSVGLCYLAGGAGILAGGFVAGRMMDHNYRHVASTLGLTIDRNQGDDIRSFPIEMARSRGSYTLLLLTTLAFVGYGWVVEKKTHPALPLVLQFGLGCGVTVLHQVYSALLVDVFPDTPGTAGASNNICRCAVAAAGVAVLQPLVDAVGRGWFFTLVGVWNGAGCAVGVRVLSRWGRHGGGGGLRVRRRREVGCRRAASPRIYVLKGARIPATEKKGEESN
ncbi:major facilitator superfamily transporter [Coniochaeta sp. 2T2.1]|nr:major facilitator superfamily transporter [Coniochaeta sp. 2T2.1]